MTSKTLLAVLLTLGAMVAAPAAASATTTQATIDSLCWLREYPDTVTCESEGYIGNGQLGVGYSGVGDATNFFNASWSIPANKEICEATLGFESPGYYSTSTLAVGEVTGGFNWSTTTWYTFDLNDIDTFVYFPLGGSTSPRVDITSTVQDWYANNQSSAFIGFYTWVANDNGFIYDPSIEIEYATSC